MITVTGATGQLGRLVIAALLEKIPAGEIVAAVRSPDKAADLAARGVVVREADYDRPDTLDAALSGTDKLLLISASEVGRRAAQHRNVIDAAKRAGVGLVVYTSLLRADTSPLPLAGEHRESEAALKASGLPHVILRNGWYTENYTAGAGAAVAAGALYGCAGAAPLSLATRADYAAAAAAVLAGDGHDGRTYELAGDEAVTLADLAAEISRQSGKDIPYVNLPEEEYAKALAGVGLPAPFAAAIAASDTAAERQGALFEDGRQLSGLTGRPTTPLADAVAAALDG